MLEFLIRMSVVTKQLYQLEDSLERAQEDVSHSLQGRAGQDSFTAAEQGVPCRIAMLQEEDDDMYGGGGLRWSPPPPRTCRRLPVWQEVVQASHMT